MILIGTKSDKYWEKIINKKDGEEMAKKIKSDFYELSLRKGNNSDFSDFKDILNNLANKIYNKRYGLKEENIFHFFKFEKNLKKEIKKKMKL